MKHIVRGLVKLMIVYSFLAVLVEIGLDNYLASKPHDWIQTTCAAIDRSLLIVKSMQIGQFWLVRASWWVFNNRVHYLLIVLVVLVGYYAYRGSTLQRPPIAKPSGNSNRYEEEKQELTRRKVEELKKSREYQEYERKKRNTSFEDEDEEDGQEGDVDWEKGEKEIFDD